MVRLLNPSPRHYDKQRHRKSKPEFVLPKTTKSIPLYSEDFQDSVWLVILTSHVG
jgi:hypothetical protein